MRAKGVGLVIKPPKSSSGRRTLELPGWAIAMLHRRRDQYSANEWNVVFTARQAADQLGHAKVSMTQDNYFGRKVVRTGAAPLLEIFDTGEAGTKRDGPRL